MPDNFIENGKGETIILNMIDSCRNHISRYRYISGNQIKLIAASCMFIDHFSKTVIFSYVKNAMLPQENAGREFLISSEQVYGVMKNILLPIGAVAFPLFCFLFVEGYIHTSNRKRFLCRLTIFALISEIPFDITFFGDFAQMDGTYPLYWGAQNVFFTYILGMRTLILIDLAKKIPKKSLSILLQGGTVLALCTAAEFFVHSDYEGYGVLLIALFYVLRKNRILQVLAPLVYSIFRHTQHPISLAVSFSLILLYNGTRGKWDINKYFFYTFYPAHILFLNLASKII